MNFNFKMNFFLHSLLSPTVMSLHRSSIIDFAAAL
ncbi:hypothetical protein SLEP1_g58146 [Rubroshorea leprosula]|uniref:Uncharacterized protein n=1 Tax=Rubroshorea leprosula TaxID=152421 RepID=A0AAV5MNC2_9ROSI|nr:hypothetical protein SLEP1_g58146 [Rubroshorea leprosula]